jgi:outer membrane lipase/esterase
MIITQIQGAIARSTRTSLATRFVQISIALTCATSNAALGQAWTNMVVFGDSLSDTGNGLALSERFFRTNPFTGQPIFYADRRPTGPAYQPGRWTNGTGVNYAGLNLSPSQLSGVWVEGLAARLNIPAPAPIQRGGSPISRNYAHGAATTGGGQQTTPIFGDVASNNIAYQVSTMYLASSPTITSNTLFVVHGGGNDIRDAVRANQTQAQVEAAARAAARNLEASIGQIVTAAAGRSVSVVWPNVVPMGSIPDMADNATWITRGNIGSAVFNQEFNLAAARLRASSPNLTLFTIDWLGLFEQINAGQYAPAAGLDRTSPVLDFNGFSNLTFNPTRNAALPAFANPDNYLFWDRVHPTARGHDILAQYTFAQIPAPGTGVLVLVLANVISRRERPTLLHT